MPSSPVEIQPWGGKGLLSLAMIVRDAAATLEPCLTGIRPWVDEMVVVDTGSQDETPQIAAGLGARVYRFPWCDDFAAARNESLVHARGSWIFWMDADDTIDSFNGEQLRRLAHGAHDPGVLGYVMQVHCPGGESPNDYTAVDHVKLFRNRPELRFEGRIHEQILPAIRRVGGEVAWTDLFVVHSGSDQSPAGRRRKHERDLRLLHRDLEERPEHPFVLFNLGMTCADMGRHEEAAAWLRRSIAAAQPTESHLRKAYALLAASLQQLDRHDEAEEVCRHGVELFAGDPELLFRQAMLAHDAGRLDQAAAGYRQVLEGQPDRHFASMDHGIAGSKARHNLACVYVDMNRPDLAEVECRRILAEEPESARARQLLAETMRRQRRSTAEVVPSPGEPERAITGVVLARNEEGNILECLKALRPHVAEILLIDMESTDRTVELARPLVTKVLRHPFVRNFDGARNIAVAEARCDWLWFVDADERIPPATGKLVQELIRSRGDEFEGLTIPFKSYCCGQWMRHCGWWPGYTGPRVLKKGRFRYAENIHGGVRLDGRELVVAAAPALAIEHYGIRSVEHYVDKVNRYSSAQAENLARSGSKWNWRAAVDGMMWELWTCYDKNPGRLDGARGWIAAWLSGQYRWLAETKLLDFGAGESKANPDAVPADLDEAIDAMQASLDRFRARVPQLPLGIVWRGEIWNESGYAEETRTFAKALAGGRRPLLLVDGSSGARSALGGSLEDRTLLQTLLRVRRPRHTIAVAHGTAASLAPDERAAVNVLRTMFETDRIPASWKRQADQFDEVWVPSRHVADAFRRSWIAPEKLRIVPGCLDTNVFCPEGETLPLPPPLQDRFVFLGVFDWVPRKGSDALLESYCREFGPEDGVGLLLKLTCVHGQPIEEVRAQLEQSLGRLGQSFAQRPDIVVCDELLTTREMAALYRSVDAFVLASRGEGWGRPYMEGLAARQVSEEPAAENCFGGGLFLVDALFLETGRKQNGQELPK